MQKIIPNLWFDSQAEEAAKLYTSLFQNSRIGRTTRYGKAGYEIHRQPEGKLMTIEFELEGQGFIGLNGFKAIMNDSRLEGIPIILETPDDTKWAAEIKLLYSFQKKICKASALSKKRQNPKEELS